MHTPFARSAYCISRCMCCCKGDYYILYSIHNAQITAPCPSKLLLYATRLDFLVYTVEITIFVSALLVSRLSVCLQGESRQMGNLICRCDNVDKRHARFMMRSHAFYCELFEIVATFEGSKITNTIRILRKLQSSRKHSIFILL